LQVVPSKEEVIKYQAEQAITEAVRDQQDESSQPPIFENEGEIKAFLLDLKAKAFNPVNIPDLVLGTIKDKHKIRELEYFLNLGITMHQAGCNETANYCFDKVLTNLNFRRSEEGAQQKYIISRIKAQNLSFNEPDLRESTKIKKKILE
jgi:hypothetical protein